MGYYVSYYTQQAPLDHGAFVFENPFISNVGLIYGFMLFLLKLCLILGLAYLVYTILSAIYNEYKRKTFLIEDTNRRIILLEEIIKKQHQNQNTNEISNDEIIQESYIDEKEEIFIVDNDGVVTIDNKEKEE